jgi:hypothetical protein
MTTFGFVFGLYSIIASLSITHMLSGIVAITRGRSKVRYSLAHALWVWVAFTMVIANWQSQWELRNLAVWPAWSVLLLISTALAQFVYCAFVTPDAPADQDIDLNEFHDRERKRFVGAFLALIVLAIVFNFSFGLTGAYDSWLRDNLLSFAVLVPTLLAIFFGDRRVQLFSAIAAALISTWFLIAAAHIVDNQSFSNVSAPVEVATP